MVEVRLGPDQMFGVVSQKLRASLGHRAGSDASDRKPRVLLAVFGRNRSAHVAERQHREPLRREPAVLSRGVGTAEGGKMESDMARQTLVQLLGQRGIAGCGKDL